MQSMINVRLLAETSAPSKARRALQDLPANFHPVLATLELLVSELVSNCIKHALLSPSDEIELSLTGDGDRLRVEVRDPGRRYGDAMAGWNRTPERPGRSLAQEGYGLFLVKRASDRSGVSWDDGTLVWFELDGHPIGAAEGRASDPGDGA